MWEYFGKPIRTVADWWHQQNQATLSTNPVQRMRKLLKACRYSPNQIADQKIFHQKLLMNFSQLRDQFPESNFDTMVDRPFEVSQEQQQISISIVGDIKIADEKGSIKLKLTIWLQHQNMTQKGPTFFIRNPDGSKYRPSLKLRNIYQWVLGGVKVIDYPQKIDWNTYTNDCLKRAVKSIIQQTQKYFPFARLKNSQNTQSKQFLINSLVQCVKGLKTQYMNISLQQIQNLRTISQVLDCQLKYIQKQKQLTSLIIKFDQQTSQKQHFSNMEILDFIIPADQNSQSLINLLSEQKALTDCQIFLQSKLDRQKYQTNQKSILGIHTQETINFSQFLIQIKKISQQKFQTRLKIWQNCQIMRNK